MKGLPHARGGEVVRRLKVREKALRQDVFPAGGLFMLRYRGTVAVGTAFAFPIAFILHIKTRWGKDGGLGGEGNPLSR